MTHYCDAEGRTWEAVDVRGTSMDKASVFEGDYDVRSAFFRMQAGCALPPHDHRKWVQVMVVEGRMRVEQEDAKPREVAAGGCYFVEAGETHTEIAMQDSILLVTQGEDRPSLGV